MDYNERLEIRIEITLRIVAHHGQLCAQSVVYLTRVVPAKIEVQLLLKVPQENDEFFGLFLAGFLQLLLYLCGCPDACALDRIYIEIDTINGYLFERHVLRNTRFGRGIRLTGVDMLGMRDIGAERLAGDIVSGYKDITVLLSHNGNVRSEGLSFSFVRLVRLGVEI